MDNRGNTELMKLLLDLDKYTTKKDVNTIIKYINSGTDLNTINNNGFTPLFLALYSKKHAKYLVEEMIKKGADINQKNSKGDTVLLSLFSYPELVDKDLIKILIDNGADLNIVNNYGNTPLTFAYNYLKIDKNYTEIFMDLIYNGADPNFQDNNGNTFIMKGILDKNLTLVKLLREAGVNVDIKNKEGLTAMDLALNLEDKNNNVFNDLVNNTTIIFNQDEGDNILMAYAYLGKQEVLDKLFKNSKFLHMKNLSNKHGQTILHYAALGCNIELVDYLYEKYNINPFLKDNYGLTAPDIYLRNCMLTENNKMREQPLSNITNEKDLRKIFPDISDITLNDIYD